MHYCVLRNENKYKILWQVHYPNKKVNLFLYSDGTSNSIIQYKQMSRLTHFIINIWNTNIYLNLVFHVHVLVITWFKAMSMNEFNCTALFHVFCNPIGRTQIWITVQSWKTYSCVFKCYLKFWFHIKCTLFTTLLYCLHEYSYWVLVGYYIHARTWLQVFTSLRKKKFSIQLYIGCCWCSVI